MKRHLIIWATLAGLCLIWLYSHQRGIGLYWREWSSFQRHFVCTNKKLELRKPILNSSIAKQDPEAAAIVEFIYQDYIGKTGWDVFGDIEYLSELSLEYPNNQYFLYDLACRLASRAYIDPQIINIIGDRLLQIDPTNGRYYFLKAWAAFYDWDDDRAEKTLGYLEKCFSSPDLKDPHKLYRARACRLLDQERPISFISNWAANWRTNDMSLLRDFKKDLMVYTQDLIVNSQSDRAMRIHDHLQRLAENNTPQMLDDPRCFYLSWNINDTWHETPQTVELKWMDLGPQRARQNRLQMLAWKQLGKHLAVRRDAAETAQSRDTETIYDETVPLVAHCFQMAIASLAAMLIFLAIGFFRVMRKSTPSLRSFFGIIILLFIYFLACRWGDYQAIHSGCGHSHYAFISTLSSWTVLATLCLCKPFGIYGLIAAGLILSIFAFVFLKKRENPNLFWRIIIRLLCIIFIVSLWLIISRLQFGTLVFDMLFLAIIIPLFCFRIRNIRTREYQNLFSRSPEGMQFRSRCLTMSCYVFLLHLTVFTLFVSHLARCTVEAVQNAKVTWQTVYPPRFAIDPNSYQNLLAQFETQDPWKINLNECLPLVEPADIPKVLTILKERRGKTPNPRASWSMGLDEKTSSGEVANHHDDYLSDLPGAMKFCGRNALPYIIPFLKDPDRTVMLIIRGRAGDTAVRQRLVELWQKDRDAGFPAMQAMWGEGVNTNTDHAEMAVPLEALVGICPYLEISDYILEYSKWTLHRKNLFIPDKELMLHFTRQQKGDLIDRWIPIAKETHWEPYSVLELLQYNIELDTASKEWLWKQMINCGNNQDKRNYLEDLNLEQKPSDYHISDELLTDCLNNKNERLRAMGQHIWRKLGKPLDEQTLGRWAEDSNFVTRADVALLRPGKIPANDPHPFVRLIQDLAE